MIFIILFGAGQVLSVEIVLEALRYGLTDTAGVLENKVLGMFHGLDD